MSGIENVPAEIVRRLLEHGHRVAGVAAAQAASFAASRGRIRESLEAADLICEVPSLDGAPVLSLAAVDGGLVCDSKSIGDLCTAVAVSVGSTEDIGDCEVWMESVSRAPQNREILSGVMSSMEVRLAASAPADLVLIDGAMLSTLINVSKSVHAARSRSLGTSALAERAAAAACPEMRDAVMEILTDKRFVAMPKYTTTNEFAAVLPPDFANQDARTVATMALRPGEMTVFAPRTRDSASEERRGLIGPALGFEGAARPAFAEALAGICSCYYRPHPWTPAFRIDVNASADEADGGDWMMAVLRAVRDATTSSGLREPFPLYLADMFAKQVSVGASPVVDMAAMSAIDDPEAKMLLAMGYRS